MTLLSLLLTHLVIFSMTLFISSIMRFIPHPSRNLKLMIIFTIPLLLERFTLIPKGSLSICFFFKAKSSTRIDSRRRDRLCVVEAGVVTEDIACGGVYHG